MASRGPKSSRFLPLGVDVRGCKCVVVGGGTIGSRKVSTLLGAGAAVTVIAPEVTQELMDWAKEGRMLWVRDHLREDHVHGAFLVVAATDDEVANARVAQLGTEIGALVCDASSAERSQVIFGALLVDDDTTVAVFTDGRDPARARNVRDRIADVVSRDSNENK